MRSLQQIKKFYQTFPNANALSSHLNWTHYRLLIRIENKDARNWYIEETVKNGWSSRQLERQIGSFYYERLLASRNKEPVKCHVLIDLKIGKLTHADVGQMDSYIRMLVVHKTVINQI
ncbi:MAG: DUF1016 N-terminal domain-containing protein [Clostridiales bacterium]|nr:DUF1016 N-terminal domain-containing protein [Clostridiales bacterium]